MKTFIFFDLEQTLIPDWFEDRVTLIPNVHPALKEWIFNQMPFTAGLLSFAVGNNDMDVFNNELRPHIETNLHFKFDDKWILTVEAMNEMMNKWNHTPFEKDNCSIFKKFGIMHAIWKNLFIEDDTRVILLDDTVEDMIIHRTTIMDKHTETVTNNSLEFVNPWTIIRQ